MHLSKCIVYNICANKSTMPYQCHLYECFMKLILALHNTVYWKMDIVLIKMFSWWLLAIFSGKIQNKNDGQSSCRMQQIKVLRLTCLLNANLAVNYVQALSRRCLKQDANCICSKRLKTMRVSMIVVVYHLKRRMKYLGHHVVRNITKFQSCRLNNWIFFFQKPAVKTFWWEQ